MLDDSYDIDDIIEALQGALLVSLSASLFYYLFGSIMGISGFIKNVIQRKESQDNFKEKYTQSLTFICGVAFSSAFIQVLYSEHIFTFMPFDKPPVYTPMIQLMVSGFLLGLGAYLANGDVSTHGLGGLPRFSKRSFVAMLLFILTAVLTCTYKLGDYLPAGKGKKQLPLPLNISHYYYVTIFLAIPFINFVTSKQKSLKVLIKSILIFLTGIILGLGLMVSSISYRSKVLHFLSYDQYWDPSLLLNQIAAIIINTIFFYIATRGNKKPIFGGNFHNPKGKITKKLVIGSILFGIGWGLSGMTIQIFMLFISNQSIRLTIYWGVSYILGVKIGQWISPKFAKDQFQLEQ